MSALGNGVGSTTQSMVAFQPTKDVFLRHDRFKMDGWRLLAASVVWSGWTVLVLLVHAEKRTLSFRRIICHREIRETGRTPSGLEEQLIKPPRYR